MFEGAGDILKGLAVVFFWIEIIVFVIAGFVFIKAGGPLLWILGPICAWASNVVIYTLGEIEVRTRVLLKKQKYSKKSTSETNMNNFDMAELDEEYFESENVDYDKRYSDIDELKAKFKSGEISEEKYLELINLL